MIQVTFLTLQDVQKPKWKLSIGLDNEYEVYVPHFIFCDDEDHAFMMASHDGLPLAVFDSHPFFPLSWVLKRFVKDDEIAAQLRQVRDNILRRNDELPL